MCASMSSSLVGGGELSCGVMACGWCCKWAFSGSAEWFVLLFLLWANQSISLSGRKTLVLEGCLGMFGLGFGMPVELVRGGMALGEAKGWVGEQGVMVEGSADGSEACL